MLDDPNNARTDYSSILAAPVVGNIISEVAPYLGLATDGVDRGQTSVQGAQPHRAGVEQRAGLPEHQGPQASAHGERAPTRPPPWSLTSIPAPGPRCPSGTTIYLYTDTYEGSHTEVPDVSGKSAEFARQMLAAAGLNCTVEGDSATVWSRARARPPAPASSVVPSLQLLVDK